MQMRPELADVIDLDINPVSDMVFVISQERDGQMLKVFADQWSCDNLGHFTEAWIPNTWTLA